MCLIAPRCPYLYRFSLECHFQICFSLSQVRLPAPHLAAHILSVRLYRPAQERRRSPLRPCWTTLLPGRLPCQRGYLPFPSHQCNVWFNFSRWNFQAQVLPICWPYTTLEPIRWQCTASEFKDISLKSEPGKIIQRFHQGSTLSEQARSMATGKAKMRS